VTQLPALKNLDIAEFCQRHGIRSFSVFGSHASGLQTAASDLDVLVEFESPVSLLKHVEVQLELEGSLGIKVDLLTPEGLHPRLHRKIIDSKKLIYEKAG
jgi:predicted nucleotidyltransferase